MGDGPISVIQPIIVDRMLNNNGPLLNKGLKNIRCKQGSNLLFISSFLGADLSCVMWTNL